MSSRKINNPAARLLEFAENAKMIDGNLSQKEGWGRLCQHDPNDLHAIFLDMISVIENIRATRKAIDELDDTYDHDLYLKPIVVLEQLPGQMYGNLTWAHIINHFDVTTMHGLAVTADVLSRLSNETPMSPEQQKSLIEQVDVLIKDVMDSDFPDELKGFLLEQLERFRSALLNYRIFGQDRLKEAIEMATGAFIVNGRSMMSHWDKSLVKKTIAFLAILANIATIAGGRPMLVEGLNRLFGSGN